MINHTFFSLVRLSIGTTSSLTHNPSDNEWKELYRMAVKQSLVGVCFAGVQKYKEIQEQRGAKANISHKTFYQWLGATVQIQQRNELMNNRCIELQYKLNSINVNGCILKGQGVAELYKTYKKEDGIIDLSLYRQSGDIDVWCQGVSIEQIVGHLKNQGYTYHATAAHVETQLYPGISVEFHASPCFLRSPWKNRRLQKWLGSFDVGTFNDAIGFRTPPLEFNIIFMMMHLFHHVLYEGVGLRQLMDYYFLLQSHSTTDTKILCEDQLSYLGLSKFASAVMWVLKEVFGLEEVIMICTPNERLGKLLLEEVLQGGNFGKYGSQLKGLREGNAIIRTYNYTRRRIRFFAMAPGEVVCAPFWSLWHYLWRMKKGY